MMRHLSVVLLVCWLSGFVFGVQDPPLYSHANLAAWCIVPFDASKRGPEERAAMLEKLGFTKFVYDYRGEHVPTFDAEMEALQRHHIDLIGWWFPGTLNAEARHILDVIKRHDMRHCDLWVMGSGEATKTPEEQAARVKSEAARIKSIAEEASKLGVRVGLYNHGGWFGEPENELAIIDELKKEGVINVGMVYNFHHGHEHLDRIAKVFPQMLPHLICVNLNGMSRTLGQILPVGQGELDLELLKMVEESGYRGPIGILNHTNEDAEQRLRDNLEGLDYLAAQLDGHSPSSKPKPFTWPEHIAKVAGKELQNGITVEGKMAYGVLPVTVECRAKLQDHKDFNILVASDPKVSGWHWELYTARGTGLFSAYLPNYGGDFRSKVNVCDGQWHDFAAILEPTRVRLFVDGVMVHDASANAGAMKRRPGDLAFGQLVEGGLGCNGEIQKVRLSTGVREIKAGPVSWEKDTLTLGLWDVPTVAAERRAPEFNPDKAPLQPEQWPHRNEPINRYRLYDFYAKEALHFMQKHPAPELLPEYPGLDGGIFGHWGFQDDVYWADGRWNDTDLGSLMSGVLHGPGGVKISKAVCVRLGDHAETSACFDPQKLSFPVTWHHGFIHFDPTRHGFMGGIIISGDQVEKTPSPVPSGPIVYHGFYRHGAQTIFAYQVNGEEWLDSVSLEQGKLVRSRVKAAESPLRELTKGGPTQWPQWIETQGVLGHAKPYAVDTLTLPVKNPWKTLFFVTGVDFFSNGDAAISTMTGEVWICRGVSEDLQHLRWKRFATGLHQPLGLKIVDDKICVLGRDQITRLHDLNGDDEADFYECLSNAQITSAGGHDFITGCEHDAEGYFYFASGNQGVCRVKPGQPVEVLATGFRNPNGLSLAADGTITTSVQEGDWTQASAICQVKKGSFYGYQGAKHGETVEPPLAFLPRGVDNSSGGQCFVDSDRWGPLGKQLIHFSSGAANQILVLREQIDGQWQGTSVPLPGDFLSGIQQGRINPKDGQLYVTGLFGWGNYAAADGCLERVRYTGGPAYMPVAVETHANGILLTFSEPLDTGVAGQVQNHFAQCWNYRYSPAYGSPEFSVRKAGVRGHDLLEVHSAHLLDGDKKLFLEIPQLVPANTVHLHVSLTAGLSRDFYVTAHRLGNEFTAFPGYQAIAKTWQPETTTASATLTLPPPAKPNPWAQGEPGRELNIKAALGLHYAETELTAKPGERVSLTFKNPDVVPHNWVLIRPGQLATVGDMANKLITDPDALSRHYVPITPDVLFYTDMVMPNTSFTIHFNAPKEPGLYPYMCTFPGHWTVMNGVLKVK